MTIVRAITQLMRLLHDGTTARVEIKLTFKEVNSLERFRYQVRKEMEQDMPYLYDRATRGSLEDISTCYGIPLKITCDFEK